MTTPKHCPGYEQLQHVQSFTCKYPTCSAEKEIFSDEFDRKHLVSCQLRNDASRFRHSRVKQAGIQGIVR